MSGLEYQINDRLSFQKCLGLTWSDAVPDQKTIWLFREVLLRRGQVKQLVRRFETHLQEAGLMRHAGKMIDASFVDVPRQRNSREEISLARISPRTSSRRFIFILAPYHSMRSK